MGRGGPNSENPTAKMGAFGRLPLPGGTRRKKPTASGRPGSEGRRRQPGRTTRSIKQPIGGYTPLFKISLRHPKSLQPLHPGQNCAQCPGGDNQRHRRPNPMTSPSFTRRKSSIKGTRVNSNKRRMNMSPQSSGNAPGVLDSGMKIGTSILRPICAVRAQRSGLIALLRTRTPAQRARPRSRFQPTTRLCRNP